MLSNCGVIEDCGEENEQMRLGEYWVCFDVEKEYVGEEDEVLTSSGRTVWRKD